NVAATALWMSTWGAPSSVCTRLTISEPVKVGDVARIAARTRYLGLKLGKPLGVAGDHRHAIPALREAPRERGARGAADTCDESDPIGHAFLHAPQAAALVSAKGGASRYSAASAARAGIAGRASKSGFGRARYSTATNDAPAATPEWRGTSWHP